MARTKLAKLSDKLNEEFRVRLTDEVAERFGIEVEHRFDFFGSGRLVTTRVDGKEFTPEQHAFIGAYSEGFAAAMGIVDEAAYA